MATVQELAEQMSRAFEGFERPSGVYARKLADGSPEWMQDVCREGHRIGDDLMMPDDWRYQLIEDAVDALAGGDHPDAAANEWEPPAYTSHLTGWLASNLNRPGYVDEAVDDYGWPGSVTQAIQYGMMAEFREVFWLVQAELERQAGEQEEEEEDDE